MPWKRSLFYFSLSYTHKVDLCMHFPLDISENSFTKNKEHLYICIIANMICVPGLTCSALIAGAEYVRWRTSMLFSSRLSSSRYDSHSSKAEWKRHYYKTFGCMAVMRDTAGRQQASQETICESRQKQPTFAALVHILWGMEPRTDFSLVDWRLLRKSRPLF